MARPVIDIISVALEHNQQSIILHTSIELFAELATLDRVHLRNITRIIFALHEYGLVSQQLLRRSLR
jgi:hypothetical protein